MPNVDLHRYSRPAMWRKMALANWRAPTDPQVYARVEVDMANALDYAQRESQRAGVRIAPAHLVIRAVALALHRHPDANAIVRFGRVYARKRVHIFCHVAIPSKKADLSGVIIRDAEGKSLAEIAAEVQQKARAVRRGEDTEFVRPQRMLDRIPQCINRLALSVVDFLCYGLNLDLRWLGVPRDPFGGALVTSVGSLGVSEAFAPLSPVTRAPLVVAVGKVAQRPVARDGQVAIRPICTLCATFDHRIMDGYLAGKLSKFITRYLADPERYEGRKEDLT